MWICKQSPQYSRLGLSGIGGLSARGSSVGPVQGLLKDIPETAPAKGQVVAQLRLVSQAVIYVVDSLSVCT